MILSKLMQSFLIPAVFIRDQNQIIYDEDDVRIRNVEVLDQTLYVFVELDTEEFALSEYQKNIDL